MKHKKKTWHLLASAALRPAGCGGEAELAPAAMMRQNVSVRVISLKVLREFWTRHPDAEKPLRAWFKLQS